MSLFSFVAGLLAGVAASCVALPLWRTATTLVRGRVRYLQAAGFVGAFALAAGILYLTIGSRQSLQRPATGGAAPVAAATASADGAGASAKSMQEAVAGLEARLARGGGSPADWSLLAQAYDFLGRTDDARRARTNAGGTTTGAVAADSAVSQMGARALIAAATAVENPTGTRASAQGGASASTFTTASPADLERRATANPRDAQTWLALADLRRSQRDYAGARTAYQKVLDLHAMSAQAWADYADVLGSLASGSLAGDAGHAIDSALALDATNPKALWLKASQANEQHRYAESLGWWQKLRSVLAPDSPDVRMVDANIAEARSLAGQASVPAAAAVAVANTGAAAEVTGTVSLDQRFTDRVKSDATLFIYAKAADSPGPPLAVLRTSVGTWPVSFRLDDSMAMIPSRRLSQFDRVVIEARISRTGQATPAPGDLYVTSAVLRPTAGARLTLVINREIG